MFSGKKPDPKVMCTCLVLIQCGDVVTTLAGGLEHEGNQWVVLALTYVPFWVIVLFKLALALGIAGAYKLLLWLDVPELIVQVVLTSVRLTAIMTIGVCIWNLYCCTAY